MTSTLSSPREGSSVSPDIWRVFRAQSALIWSGRRRGLWVALAIVLTQLTLLASNGLILGFAFIVRGEGDASTTEMRLLFDLLEALERDLDFAFDEGSVALAGAFIASMIWAFFWPFRVWRHEPPSRRGYHWAMPVDRAVHDGIRVLAGAVWLIALQAVFVLLVGVTALAFGHTELLSGFSVGSWLSVLLAPQGLYLAVSVATVRCEHPAAWLWGTLGVIWAAWSVAAVLSWNFATRSLAWIVWEGEPALARVLGGLFWEDFAGGSPQGMPWLVYFLLWLGLALGAVVWACWANRKGLS